MAYLAVNRDGEELVFNDCPIYDRVEDTWKIPMLRWNLFMMIQMIIARVFMRMR